MSDRFFENSASKSSGSTLDRTSAQAQIDIPTLLMEGQLHQKRSFDRSSPAAQAYLNVGDSVAHIQSNDGNTPDGRAITTVGSGFFVRRDGVLATAYHVIQNEKGGLTVTTSDGVPHEARVRTLDVKHDLALLDVIPVAGERFKSAPLADSSSEMQTGQSANVLGFPGNAAELHVSPGRARQASQLKEHAGDGFQYLPGESPDRKVLVTDMMVQGGVSGGPLVASNGRVVGVEDLGVSKTALTISTPIEDLRNLLNNKGITPDGTDSEVQPAGQAIATDQRRPLDSPAQYVQTGGGGVDTIYNPFASNFRTLTQSDASYGTPQQEVWARQPATSQQDAPVQSTRATTQTAPVPDSSLDFFANLKTIPWGN